MLIISSGVLITSSGVLTTSSGVLTTRSGMLIISSGLLITSSGMLIISSGMLTISSGPQALPWQMSTMAAAQAMDESTGTGCGAAGALLTLQTAPTPPSTWPSRARQTPRGCALMGAAQGATQPWPALLSGHFCWPLTSSLHFAGGLPCLLLPLPHPSGELAGLFSVSAGEWPLNCYLLSEAFKACGQCFSLQVLPSRLTSRGCDDSVARYNSTGFWAFVVRLLDCCCGLLLFPVKQRMYCCTLHHAACMFSALQAAR